MAPGSPLESGEAWVALVVLPCVLCLCFKCVFAGLSRSACIQVWLVRLRWSQGVLYHMSLIAYPRVFAFR